MNVLIASNDQRERECIRELLSELEPNASVVASLDTVQDTVRFLSRNGQPDLSILSTILKDGEAFEVFRKVNYNRPVIFIADHGSDLMQAFKVFCLDIVFRPVIRDSMAASLNKYHLITQSIGAAVNKQETALWTNQGYKKRFLGKVGQRTYFIDTADISYFQADNKIVYLVDKDNNRYVVSQTMEQLLQLLDPQLFFRLNRRYIVKINAIEQVKPYYNKRLKLAIRGNFPCEDLVISRERVAAFRQWAEAQ